MLVYLERTTVCPGEVEVSTSSLTRVDWQPLSSLCPLHQVSSSDAASPKASGTVLSPSNLYFLKKVGKIVRNVQLKVSAITQELSIEFNLANELAVPLYATIYLGVVSTSSHCPLISPCPPG